MFTASHFGHGICGTTQNGTRLVACRIHGMRQHDAASEIAELSAAGFKVRRGLNDLRLGIAAVSARLEDGRLRVLEGRCPNLLSEAGIYRWGESEDRRAEVPVDEHNHALAALRYLIATIDKSNLARRQGKSPSAAGGP